MARRAALLLLASDVGRVESVLLQNEDSDYLVPDFKSFMADFKRSYSHNSDEYHDRLQLYRERMEIIKAQNSDPHKLWTAGENEFTDRTEVELRDWKGYVRTPGGRKSSMVEGGPATEPEPSSDSLPDQVSWRTLPSSAEGLGAVDQGACGSCWAAATILMMTTRHEIGMRQNRTFSLQQLVNCVPNPQDCGGSGGCDGATVELAMDYVAKMGLKDMTAVPYKAQNQTCAPTMAFNALSETQANENPIQEGRTIGLKSWFKLPENKVLPLMHAVVEGPVAISLSAKGWFPYKGGIYNKCDPDGNNIIDHAVVLMGFNKDGNNKYWEIRNSWGLSWGENGFLRMARKSPEEEDKLCGIDNEPGIGTACKPYPKEVTVCGSCGLLYDSVIARFSPDALSGGGSSPGNSGDAAGALNAAASAAAQAGQAAPAPPPAPPADAGAAQAAVPGSEAAQSQEQAQPAPPAPPAPEAGTASRLQATILAPPIAQ